MRIIVDAMGGDNAPSEIVKGSVSAARKFGEEIILVGDEEKINNCLKQENIEGLNISTVHAKDKVEMDDDPTTVLRQKTESSMAVAFKMLKEEQGDALVSAGSTGALLTGSTLIVKRIKGIKRVAIVAMLPSKKGSTLLVDCGANSNCTPEQLLEFAIMGSYYTKALNNINLPKVGLMNNGTEEGKGDTLRVETYELFKKAHEEKKINFFGNVEGRDCVSGICDVVVCDGFTGNVLLKTVEGVAMMLMSLIKEMFLQNTRGKIAALLLKPALNKLRSKVDYNKTGGAPFLGASKPVIKAHGSSKAETFENAILQAINFTKSGIIKEIEQSVNTTKT